MKYYRNTLLVLCTILMEFTTAFAQQDFQGVAYYESKTTIDLDNFGGREMTPERKKMIMERMKNMFEKTYKLTFNKEESTYKEEEKLEAPGQGRGMRFGGGFSQGSYYKNIKTNQALQEQDFMGKQFLIKDSLPKLEWKLTGETKQIGQYMCMKATAIKPVDQMDFRSMRRRNKDKDDKEENTKNDSETTADTTKTKQKNLFDEIEIPESIEVTAWYTMQIPINQGPGEYYGLPGLILEINADRTTILCNKIILNPSEKEDIVIPSKGKEVTRKEYGEIVKQKIEEMREMYGRGRGGRRR